MFQCVAVFERFVLDLWQLSCVSVTSSEWFYPNWVISNCITIKDVLTYQTNFFHKLKVRNSTNVRELPELMCSVTSKMNSIFHTVSSINLCISLFECHQPNERCPYSQQMYVNSVSTRKITRSHASEIPYSGMFTVSEAWGAANLASRMLTGLSCFTYEKRMRCLDTFTPREWRIAEWLNRKNSGQSRSACPVVKISETSSWISSRSQCGCNCFSMGVAAERVCVEWINALQTCLVVLESNNPVSLFHVYSNLNQARACQRSFNACDSICSPVLLPKLSSI